MRKVDKLYLIDQRVVFYCKKKEGMAIGSLEGLFDDIPQVRINGYKLVELLKHFDIDWQKIRQGYGDTQRMVGLIETLEEDNSLFYMPYHDHFSQVVDLEAEIEANGILSVRVTYQYEENAEKYVQEFCYSGRYEVWWESSPDQCSGQE